ncbi:MAG: isoaspartyl peptidase/L-asparaginase, partial [Thermomicrobiales bacterium]
MKPRVVASENGWVGIGAALEVMLSGGSAADAIVAGLEIVEANPDDHSVGYSGLPNMLGEVELDASIMVGDGLRAGSIAALCGYQDAARLAKRVMDDLPHVLIAGEGASRLAHESGLERRNLLTAEAERIWRSRMDGEQVDPMMHNFLQRMKEIVGTFASDPQLVEPPHGTVNFICQDREGRISSG